jgi:hypothetical protein
VIQGNSPLCYIFQNLSTYDNPITSQNNTPQCNGCTETISNPIRVAHSSRAPGKTDNINNIDAEDMGYCDITNDNTTITHLGLNQAEVYNISELQLFVRMVSLISKTSPLDLAMFATNIKLSRKFYANDHPDDHFRSSNLDFRISFHSRFEAYRDLIIPIVKGNISRNLAVSSPPLTSTNDAEYTPPAFDDATDKVNGLGIAIHDVWSAKGEVTSLKICASTRSYCGNLKFYLFDDYGLDRADIISTNQQWSASIPLIWTKDGFHAWYILQHFKCPSRNANYSLHRPFITEVIINVPFNGVY